MGITFNGKSMQKAVCKKGRPIENQDGKDLMLTLLPGSKILRTQWRFACARSEILWIGQETFGLRSNIRMIQRQSCNGKIQYHKNSTAKWNCRTQDPRPGILILRNQDLGSFGDSSACLLFLKVRRDSSFFFIQKTCYIVSVEHNIINWREWMGAPPWADCFRRRNCDLKKWREMFWFCVRPEDNSVFCFTGV